MQKNVEMETFMPKEQAVENGQTTEYTVVSLDELPENYSSDWGPEQSHWGLTRHRTTRLTFNALSQSLRILFLLFPNPNHIFAFFSIYVHANSY